MLAMTILYFIRLHNWYQLLLLYMSERIFEYETLETHINGKKKLLTALATLLSLDSNDYDNWTMD